MAIEGFLYFRGRLVRVELELAGDPVALRASPGRESPVLKPDKLSSHAAQSATRINYLTTLGFGTLLNGINRIGIAFFFLPTVTMRILTFTFGALGIAS